jgi:hypothetical protein
MKTKSIFNKVLEHKEIVEKPHYREECDCGHLAAFHRSKTGKCSMKKCRDMPYDGGGSCHKFTQISFESFIKKIRGNFK